MTRLTHTQMRQYLEQGYVTVQTDFPPEFHQTIWDQADTIFQSDGNPENDIYPRIAELGQVVEHPSVRGALSSILGDDYFVHPHRHCHLTPPGKAAQKSHKDSYEDDENVRHHRSRWAMAFYYPQDVDDAIGPTTVTPGSQYYTEREGVDSLSELKVEGAAGTVTIVHYDIWHRASANRTDTNRYMMKFLFCRATEPTQPTWSGRDTAVPFDTHPEISRHLWDWNAGRSNGSNAEATDSCELIKLLRSSSEHDRIEASYGLGTAGAVEQLMESLSEESSEKLERNLERSHTNPSQLDARYGLSIGGTKAISALTAALRSSDPWMRAASADILGDVGRAAEPSIQNLIELLDDESEWVRRNAVEALGNLKAGAAIFALTTRLHDENDRVRHNAALSLIKIGEPSRGAIPDLERTTDDGNRYVRALSQMAIDRLNIRGIK